MASFITFLIVVLVLAAIVVVLVAYFFHRASREVSLIRTGAGGRKVVMDGGVLQDFPMLDSVPSTTGTLAVFSQQTLFWRIVRRDIKPHIVEMRRQPS